MVFLLIAAKMSTWYSRSNHSSDFLEREGVTLVTENLHPFSKLLENMPASLAELARTSGVHERSIMRMRDGNRVQRSTANKVLRGLSQLYGQSFTLDNVTDINIY